VTGACIVSVVVDEDEWDLYDSLVGVALILVLLAYGRYRRRTVDSGAETLAVGAVWAFCVLLVFGFVLGGVQGVVGWPPFGERPEFDGFWFCVAWALLTALFAAVLQNAGERLLRPSYRRDAAMRRPGGHGQRSRHDSGA
jgi:hypothetical protein